MTDVTPTQLRILELANDMNPETITTADGFEDFEGKFSTISSHFAFLGRHGFLRRDGGIGLRARWAITEKGVNEIQDQRKIESVTASA